jgi:cell wall-associated NlpC family hydrolase
MKNSISLFVLCLIVAAFPSFALAAKSHKVKKNDSLYSLAKKYHVTVNDIKAANNLVSKHIKSGDVLVIPPRSVNAGNGEETGKQRVTGANYRVKKGDSLARVARKAGVSVEELKRLNGLHGNKLKPGKVLVLKKSEPAEKPVKTVAKKYSLGNDTVLSDNQYDQTLAELTDFDPEKKVDLSKNMELSLDVSKRLNKTAYSFLGTRYRFGGTSRSGIDCSSFVQNVFKELQVSLPRTAREQYWVGEKVEPYDLQKGDLLFFHTYASYPSHVGIYLGDNKMIHASSRDRKVVISPITSYYRSRFIGAKRMAKINPQIIKLEELLAGTGIEEEKEEDVVKNDTLGVNLGNQNLQ